MNPIERLANVIREADYELSLTILEVGARPNTEEPFYQLPSLFPGSRIAAVEADEDVCARQNARNRSCVTFYPAALGRTEERRKFYITQGPQCSSLYPPNEEVLSRYNGLDAALTKRVTTVSTVSLDGFVAANSIGAVDFIKIDIQGAELEVFQGGVKTLANVLAVVTEVGLIEHYVGQPLFGNLCDFLSTQGLQFQRFLYLGGRGLKPIVVEGNPGAVSQHMWADMLLLRNLFGDRRLDREQYLKVAVLVMLYNCLDVTLYCLREVDLETGSDIGEEFLRRLKAQ